MKTVKEMNEEELRAYKAARNKCRNNKRKT